MRYFETNTLMPFAIYCFVAGLGALSTSPSARPRNEDETIAASPSTRPPTTSASATPSREMSELTLGQGPLDSAHPGMPDPDEGEPDQAEARADDLIRPRGDIRDARHDPAEPNADGDCGQAGAPPGEVRPLVREPRPPGGVSRLVEAHGAGGMAASDNSRYSPVTR